MTQQPKEEQQNTYMIDTESIAEMTRLLEQDRLVTSTMGGLFSERQPEEMENIVDVLDAGCGPGGWVHEVAHTYPTMEVVGIDISQRMIEYAQTHALVRGLTNTHFEVMNIVEPLKFSDQSFDLVNARTVVGCISRTQWPQVIQEYKRLLRPGGVVRLTEAEWGFTNKPAVEKFSVLINKVGHLAGNGFSPSGHHLGITFMLKRLLQDAGFTKIQMKAHASDFSAGSPNHAITSEDFKFLFKLIQPALVMMKLANQEEVDTLYEQALDELSAPDFCAISFLLTVWGEKE